MTESCAVELTPVKLKFWEDSPCPSVLSYCVAPIRSNYPDVFPAKPHEYDDYWDSGVKSSMGRILWTFHTPRRHSGERVFARKITEIFVKIVLTDYVEKVASWQFPTKNIRSDPPVRLQSNQELQISNTTRPNRVYSIDRPRPDLHHRYVGTWAWYLQ